MSACFHREGRREKAGVLDAAEDVFELRVINAKAVVVRLELLPIAEVQCERSFT